MYCISRHSCEISYLHLINYEFDRVNHEEQKSGQTTRAFTFIDRRKCSSRSDEITKADDE